MWYCLIIVSRQREGYKHGFQQTFDACEPTEETEYTYQLLNSVEEEIVKSDKDSLTELCKHIKGLPDTGRIREIRSKSGEDVRFGDKTANSTFFGFKNPLAMTEERIITGIKATHGGGPDCNQLPGLPGQSLNSGIKAEETTGDMAYVSEDNLAVCEEKGVTLCARTNTAAAAAAAMPLDEGFLFNKDAGLLQCPAGGLAMRVEKREAKNGNTYLKFLFSRERLKIRHCIEEKNGEMKVDRGLGRAGSAGLTAMRLQMYFTAFVVNVKRITKLTEPGMV